MIEKRHMVLHSVLDTENSQVDNQIMSCTCHSTTINPALAEAEIRVTLSSSADEAILVDAASVITSNMAYQIRVSRKRGATENTTENPALAEAEGRVAMLDAADAVSSGGLGICYHCNHCALIKVSGKRGATEAARSWKSVPLSPESLQVLRGVSINIGKVKT